MAARWNNSYSTYGKGSARKYRARGQAYGYPSYRRYRRRVYAPRIRGRGRYSMSDLVRAGWGTVKDISKKYVQPFERIGGALLGSTGRNVGKMLGEVTGLGNYRYKAGKSIKGLDPPVVANKKDGVIVSHREFLGNIVSSEGFVNATYPINPGDPATFPWLSSVASSFEQYMFVGCVFEYITTSSDALAAGNPALGTVMMATDYNAAAASYTSEVQMLNSEYATSCKPSCSFMHPVECSPHLTSTDILYVAPGGTIPSGADPRLYNLGNFQIGTTGQQTDGGQIGQLWVTYQCKLLKPQIAPPVTLNTAIYRLQNTASASPYGLDQSVIQLPNGTPCDNIGVVFNSSSQFTIPPSNASVYYIMTMQWAGSVAAVNGTGPAIGGTNATFAVWDDTLPLFASSVNVTGIYIIKVTNPSLQATIVLSPTGGILPAGTTSGNLFLTQIDPRLGEAFFS